MFHDYLDAERLAKRRRTRCEDCDDPALCAAEGSCQLDDEPALPQDCRWDRIP